MIRLLVIVLSIAAGLYLFLCVDLYFTQRSMIYFPVRAANTDPSTLLTLPTDAGKVLVSARPATGPDALIYFGGNAEDVSLDMPEISAAFPGVAIYLMHYRGYGGSAGKPTEQALIADAFALFDRVHAEHPNVMMIGRSLGSGVAVHVASERPVQRLVLVTPFDSLADVAGSHYPWLPVRLLLRDRFDSWRYAPKVTAPVTVIAAEEDEIVPRASTERLITRFRSGQIAPYTIPGADHNSISDYLSYWPLVRGQSAALSSPRPGDPPQELTATDTQRLLEGPCQAVTSTAPLPRELKAAFAKMIGEPLFALANPGETFQATDVMTGQKLPLRRMVIAGKCGSYWFVHYERGGIAHNYALVFFQTDAKGEMTLVWGGQGFDGASDCAELSKLVASKKFAERHQSFW